MKEKDIMKDIRYHRIANQIFYNESLIHSRNPEVRQLFTEMRDDEMRAIGRLEQLLEKIKANPGIITRIFTSG